MAKESTDSLQSHLVGFNRDFLDPQTPVSCIGQGSLGGKANGLVSIREILRSELNMPDFPGIAVNIPSLSVICTGVFDAFMTRNNLFEIANSDLPDDRIAYAFQKADLPFEVLGDLRSIVDQVHTPLAIRSSSLLEDAKHEPFAGVYATKMIPNNRYDPDLRFRQLVEAIKFVYASTYTKSAKEYRKAVGHTSGDEKMAVIIQEMVGKRYYNRFYPEMSGVARSYNYYPMQPAKTHEGVIYLALGLGKIIVDGGISWSYSPSYPKVEPPFGSVEKLMKETQTEFWVVNMGDPPEYDPIRETEYLLLENITAAEKDGSLRYIASTFNPLSRRLSAGTGFKGPRALTFAPLLVLQELPFNDLMNTLLSVCQKVLDTPVEIEFAMTFNPHRFSFLQVRAMMVPESEVQVSEDELYGSNTLVASTNVLGNGEIDTVKDIVYVKPEAFELKHTWAVVPELQRMNSTLIDLQRPYLLIVLGRLGTTDPWLGIPVIWSQVSGAKVIVEATQENVRVELSQGSHYFHNILNLGVKYFTLPLKSQFKIDWEWLSEQNVVEETGFLRHVSLPHPLHVKVDGLNSRGVICKPPRS
jgi:hypothetical protein